MTQKHLIQECYDMLFAANFCLGEIADGQDCVYLEKLTRSEMRKRAERTLEGQAALLDRLAKILAVMNPPQPEEGLFDDQLGTNTHDDAGPADNRAEGAPGHDQRDGHDDQGAGGRLPGEPVRAVAGHVGA